MDGLAPLARRWGLPLLWLTLPFLAGPSFADALDPRSRPIQVTASLGLWALWAVALVATLVPRTVSLTLVRITVPASVVAAGWAALVVPDGAGAPEAVALGITTLSAVVALSAPVGEEFVNGSAYGEERRLPLRPPGPLVLGPIELVWALVVAGAVAGPLLLAAEQWVLGAVLIAVGWAVAALGVRSLHQLARRWVVFVPAGMVLVDTTVLTDALLARRHRIAHLGPAPAENAALDLTAGALGLALQLEFTEPEVIVPVPPRPARGERSTTPLRVEAVTFTPSRSTAVLREAARRRVPVG
ncbi:hypothetical protein [Rhabdothermincola salaria]|uniref:hypothetical protein n=1 Tax=Rhabdothermincola salaria TaxID=2903142 RepID=UPI001E2AFF3B|nr:hypothetical protein [Rhabdothermincola salaria]MCD9623735.1 hypothetical protein [Rhabdothermincola salaria]